VIRFARFWITSPSCSPNVRFNPVDFYKQAGAWYSINANEATLRSVVSRAYYAAHLIAREQAGISRDERDGHKATIDFYQAHGPFAVGQRLRALRISRNDADYDLAKICIPRHAQKALQDTQKILAELGEPTS
jgi:hypothetical protein